MREQLRSLVETLKHEQWITSSTMVYDVCFETISKIESIIASQWVPVAKRLPDDGEECFVLIGDRIRLGYRCRTRGIWLSVDTGDLLTGVTHWHAIDYPEPPQAQP